MKQFVSSHIKNACYESLRYSILSSGAKSIGYTPNKKKTMIRYLADLTKKAGRVSLLKKSVEKGSFSRVLRTM